MHEFQWIGINKQGKKVTGIIHADHKNHAEFILKKQSIFILSMRKKVLTLRHLKQQFSSKLKLDWFIHLNQLLDAGIAITDALTLITEMETNSVTTYLSLRIKEKIENGATLSTALSQLTPHFDQCDFSLIAAGEKSGELSAAFRYLVQLYTQSTQLKNKIRKALFYPACILIITFVMSLGLMIFVIPEFQGIYHNFNGQLPALTQTLISISNTIKTNGIYFLLSLFIFILFILLFRIKIKLKKINWHCIPFLRKNIVANEVARWSQLMTLALRSGVPMIDALTLAQQSISTVFFREKMEYIAKAVMRGETLFHALAIYSSFPIRAKTMIGIGENADTLPQMMEKIAVIYTQQTQDTLDRLSKLLEPVIMMIVAGIVSSMIIAIYLPIFKMGNMM